MLVVYLPPALTFFEGTVGPGQTIRINITTAELEQGEETPLAQLYFGAAASRLAYGLPRPPSWAGCAVITLNLNNTDRN